MICRRLGRVCLGSPAGGIAVVPGAASGIKHTIATVATHSVAARRRVGKSDVSHRDCTQALTWASGLADAPTLDGLMAEAKVEADESSVAPAGPNTGADLASEGRSGPFAPLARATFRSLWFGALASNIGDWMENVGSAWLMTELSRSATLVGLVQTFSSLPFVLFVLPAGALADIVDRRRP
jgi:Transmembrane secretion effector